VKVIGQLLEQQRQEELQQQQQQQEAASPQQLAGLQQIEDYLFSPGGSCRGDRHCQAAEAGDCRVHGTCWCWAAVDALECLLLCPCCVASTAICRSSCGRGLCGHLGLFVHRCSSRTSAALHQV
jgi:hypothetical protein